MLKLGAYARIRDYLCPSVVVLDVLPLVEEDVSGVVRPLLVEVLLNLTVVKTP